MVHTVCLILPRFHVLGIDRLSPGRAPFDGWAEDTTEPGQYKGKCIYILDVSPIR